MIVRVLPPVFSTEMAWAVAVVPVCCGEKASKAGCRVTAAGATAVPVSAAWSWPPATLAKTVSEAVRVPCWLGANWTWRVQVAPGEMVWPEQLSDSEKSAGLLPERLTEVGVSGRTPVLETVNQMPRELPWLRGIRLPVQPPTAP